jgi:dual specificity MAP kinase phosphatase
MKTRGEIQKVIDNLYITDFFAALKKKKLNEIKTTHILICANELDIKFPKDFIYKKINIADVPKVKINIYFEECYNFIENVINNKGIIVIHW